jgi:HAD superfamily hydrolase (TIGR01490 family)
MTKKRFAAFDLDGTLFRAGLSRNLMLGLIEQGIIDKKALDDLDPYYYLWKNREQPDAFKVYDDRHVEIFSKYIKGVHLNDIEKAIDSIVNKIYKKVYIYTRDLTRKLHDDGYTLIAITASPHEIARPFAVKYDFDIVYADHIRCDSRGFCIDTRTSTATNKKGALQELIDEYDLATGGSYAVGDTASDIGMLELAENPIAFNPSRELFEAAKERGWQVVVERKDVVYHLKPDKDRYYIS